MSDSTVTPPVNPALVEMRQRVAGLATSKLRVLVGMALECGKAGDHDARIVYAVGAAELARRVGVSA